MTDVPDAESPRLIAVYRSGLGEVREDWPIDRIAEALADDEGTLWLDVEHQGERLERVETLLAETFGVHPLAVEDALGEANTPKVDDWGRDLLIVFHAVAFDEDAVEVRLIEVDLLLGRNFLVTFHVGRVPAVERLRKAVGRDLEGRLARGADHLAYLLIDGAVDEHLDVIEHLDDAIDAIQDRIFEGPGPATLREIFRIKRSVLQVHRIIGPQREVVNRLARDPYPQIDDRDRVYFRDIHDHLVRVVDLIDNVREQVTGTLETYLSVSSNRTNDAMKALTLVTVLFLPLNVLVGFFGMNFFGENIELRGLRVPHAALFAAALVVMAASPLALYLWARRKRWF